MIPKIIHYCWFGGKPLPRLAEKCIRSWKKYCSDYKIIEWNESNYDISSAPLYVRQAYEAKKWAFVTDYVRLQVVYENGGIYLDTDVEIIKPFDDLLKYDAFFGFEDEKLVNTGLGFGSVRDLKILKDIMADYSNISFIKENGEVDMTPCTFRNSHVFMDGYGFELNGTTQIIKNCALFSSEYFSPRKWNDEKINITGNTYSIHHYVASWKSKEDKKREREYFKAVNKRRKIHKIKSFFKKLFGEKNYNRLKQIKRFLIRK